MSPPAEPADAVASPPPCCSARRPDGDALAAVLAEGPGPATVVGSALLDLPGATFRMGSDDERFRGDGEGPSRPVAVAGFRIAAHTVSNADFDRFVTATGYTTTAERLNWSFVFGGLLPEDFPATRAAAQAPWWRQVHGATWRRPEGPGSDVHTRGDHPAVHVSWVDARAYCRWAGGRLPSEVEWEYASRGGLVGRRFPWGDELTPGGEHRMNVFQGEFPAHDTGEDGYTGTAPVDAFPPNGFGLYNTTGNVWEWCADRFGVGRADRVMRGGSYLCHHSYCWRYRCAARSGNTPDSSAGNIGFRMAADVV